MARQHISPEVTMNGFKKCCISTAVNGIDDDMLANRICMLCVFSVRN